MGKSKSRYLVPVSEQPVAPVEQPGLFDPPAPRNSKNDRRICLEAHGFYWNDKVHVKCHVCSLLINVETKGWEADHIARKAEDGPSTARNLLPICVPCHRKKSGLDTKEIAKGKRVRNKRLGLSRSSRPMLGSRRSGYKKKMDGTVIKR